MEKKEKFRKTYKKPQVNEVKVVIEEAVLQGCKTAPGDVMGKAPRGCQHPACKITFGS